MTSIAKWVKFLIPLKLIILMINEALMLLQSKQDNSLIIFKNITNVPMDTSI